MFLHRHALDSALPPAQQLALNMYSSICAGIVQAAVPPSYPRLSSACERAKGLNLMDMDAGSRATCSSARRGDMQRAEVRTSCTLPCTPPWPA